MPQATANYIQPRAEQRRRRIRNGRGFVSNIALGLSMLLLVSGFAVAPTVAFAQTTDDDETFAPIGSLLEDTTSEDILSEINQRTLNPSTGTVEYLIQRVLAPGYINELPSAFVSGAVNGRATELGFYPSKKACSTNQRGAGTIVYHNCDVPNFSAQMIQSVYSIFDRSGPQNATPVNSTIGLFDGIGQSKRLPGDTVPADYENAPAKYTGLEIFGYNLNLTSYYGEWDRIQTLNKARLLNNFSVFDTIGLTSKMLGDAIGGAFNLSSTLAAEGWNTGGILGAIAGAFTGFFEGAAKGAVTTLLDTSEANIIFSYGWYRAGFSRTSYGMRELQDQEIDAQIRAAFLTYLNSTMPEDQTYDEWLRSADPTRAPLAEGPKPAISKCVVTEQLTVGGPITTREATSYGIYRNTEGPGIPEAECQTIQDSLNTTRWNRYYCGTWQDGIDDNRSCIVLHLGRFYQKFGSTSTASIEPGTDGSRWQPVTRAGFALELDEWTVDGNQKPESFNTWYERVQGELGNFDANIALYEVDISAAQCTPANGNSTDPVRSQEAYTTWLQGCWTPSWKAATTKNETENQDNQNTGWLTSLLTPQILAQWASAPGNEDVFNFNYPWQRYVCLNPDGTDVITGYYSDTISGGNQGTPILASVYDRNGNITPECAAATDQASFRAPIQGGLLGSGYDFTTVLQSPELDTRHINNFVGPSISVLHPLVFEPIGKYAELMFAFASMLNIVANEFILWTYTPVLEASGFDDVVIDLINGFRDSIFFPLVLLVIAMAGLYILWQAGARRQYREGFTSAIYLVLIFLLGGALMANAANVVHLVDRVPANMEKAVMALIVQNAVTDDELCATSASVAAQDLNGLATANLLESSTASFTNLFGSGYSAADDPLRSLLCLSWKAFVYEPWVFAQWGTSSSELDADKMLNTNQGLVGDAAVPMGGGVTVNNWAVYQLYTTKLGSTFEPDMSIESRIQKEKDFYRIVDMQAGPNNGAGTDSRYLETWSGVNPVPRALIAVTSIIASGFGSAVIIGYSFTKILLTFISVAMLIFLPFAFLIGLFPTKRRHLKTYALTILGLMLQRLAMVVVLSIFFLLLLTALQGAQGYFAVFVLVIIFSVIFLKFRKNIMNFALFDGAQTGGGLLNQARNAAKKVPEVMPTAIRNRMEMTRAKIRYGVPGVAIGTLLGRSPKKSWERSTAGQESILQRKQRGRGFDVIDRVNKTEKRIIDDLKRKVKDEAKGEGIVNAIADVERQSDPMRRYQEQLLKYEADIREYYDLLEKGSLSEREIPIIDERTGQPLLDARGQEITRTAAIFTFYDYERQESIEETIKIKPVAPIAPKFNERELELAEIKEMREYAAISKHREEAERKRFELREKLYATENGKAILGDLGPMPDESKIREAIEKSFPDSKGFTAIQRDKLKKSINELQKLEKVISADEEKLKSIADGFRRVDDLIDHSKDPEVFMRNIIEDANSKAGFFQEKPEGT